MGGTPVFVGTRVPAQSLFDYLEAGDSLEEFLEAFPTVSREQAIAALEIEREAVTAVAAAHLNAIASVAAGEVIEVLPD